MKVVGTVLLCFVVLVGVFIYRYIKRKKGSKQKAEADKKNLKYISQTPTSNNLENVPMLLKAKIPQEDQENAAAPEISIELASKKIPLPKTSGSLENDETENAQEEENQSIKDRALMLGQKIKDNKQSNEEREE